MDDLATPETVPAARVRAEQVLAVYRQGGDLEEALTDLITDLNHLADAEGVDFDAILIRSAYHYTAELP